MTEPEDRLKAAFASREKTAPPFNRVMDRAERQVRARPGRRVAAAGFVAAGLVAMLAIDLTPQPNFISEDELLGSTSWSAPSDVLLPNHQFDIYQDLPELLESTKSTEGALL